MRIMMSAGGTGGGVYPAFAVAEALKREFGRQADLIFVGGVGGNEPAMLAQSGITWTHTAFIQGGPVHGVSPLRMISSAVRLLVGFVQALVLVLRWRPVSVFITGGWASLPVALAAWLLRIPVTTFVPDIEPGLTLKVTSRFARQVAASVPDTEAYFKPGQVVVTGYPLRADIVQATRADGLARFDLDPARRTLFVVGGSSGARSINRAMLAIVPELLADDTLQILHVTGRLDWDEVSAARAQFDLAVQARYHAVDYLHGEMGLALAAADLAVSRAGASTLGEFTQCGLPAILVPYPHAWRYQKVNADYLAQQGAALRLDDERLAVDLLPTLRRLLADPATLQQMAECARMLSRPDGAANIAHLLIIQEAA